MSFIELAAERLKEHGHRMTQSRHQILALFDASQKILTADDIQQNSADKKLDSATVYRILQVLEDLQIVKKVHSAGGYFKYPLESESRLGWQFCIDVKTRRVVVMPLTDIDTQRSKKIPWFVPHHISCEILGDFGGWVGLDATPIPTEDKRDDDTQPSTIIPEDDSQTRVKDQKGEKRQADKEGEVSAPEESEEEKGIEKPEVNLPELSVTEPETEEVLKPSSDTVNQTQKVIKSETTEKQNTDRSLLFQKLHDF